MAQAPRRDSSGGTDFRRRMTLPEGDRRSSGLAQWNGSSRWFRSPNIVDLWDYRSAEEKRRIGDFMRRRFGAGLIEVGRCNSHHGLVPPAKDGRDETH